MIDIQRPKREDGQTRRSLPLYYQIYLVLKQQLLEGQYPKDQPFPGDEELRRRFDVSRVTVRKTMQLLEEDNLITRARGKGTFPTVERETPAERANISGLYENLATISARGSAKVLTFEIVNTPKMILDEASDFGPRALKIERIRRFKTDVLYFVRSYIPEHIGKQITIKDVASEPILFVLDHLGRLPENAMQTLSAVAATPDLAGELGVNVGAPLIYMKRQFRDQGKAIIEFSEYYYRPEKFAYQIELTRRGTSDAPRWIPLES